MLPADVTPPPSAELAESASAGAAPGSSVPSHTDSTSVDRPVPSRPVLGQSLSAARFNALDQDLLLEHAWALYFDDEAKQPAHSSAAAAAMAASTPTVSASASLIGTVQSIHQFWLHYKRVDASLSKLSGPDGTASQGKFEIKMWKKNDAAGNAAGAAAGAVAAAAALPAAPSSSSAPALSSHSGGKWILKSTPSNDLVATRAIWREMMMALVGEQLPLAHTAVGCVLACRPHRNEVQLWVNQAPYAALPVVPSSPQEDQRRRAALAAAAASAPAGASDGDTAASAAAQLALVSHQSHDLKLRAIATSMRRLLNLQDGVRISYVPHSYEKARAAQVDHAAASKRSSSSSRHKREHRSTHPSASSASQLHHLSGAHAASSSASASSSVPASAGVSAASSTHSTPPRPSRDRERQRDRLDRSDRGERTDRGDRDRADRGRDSVRESDRADRAMVRAVHAKTTKAQTWPIRPPEQFMAPPPPPDTSITAAADETVAAAASIADPAGLHPLVDPHLLAALSLSANPLPEPDSALSRASSAHSSVVLLDEGSTAPASAPALSSVVSSSTPASPSSLRSRHLPPSQLQSPDFQRFLIAKTDTDTQGATNSTSDAVTSQSAPPSSMAHRTHALSATSGVHSASPARMVRELGAGAPLTSLTSPLANLLGLTSPPRAHRELQPQPQQLMPGSFSPASASPTQSSALALSSGATPPRVALLHPGLSIPPGLPLPLPSSVATAPGSSSKSLLHPGVHVLNSSGRPSAIAGSGSLALRGSVLGQSRMSREEKAQATAWLERVHSKQEQAKSWPHVQHQAHPIVIAQHQTTQAHLAPAPLARELALNLAHVQHRGPNSIPLIPHPSISSLAGTASISTTASASGGSSAKVSPRISSSNTELVLRARTESQSRNGSVSLSKQSSGSGSHSNVDSGVTSAAGSGLLTAAASSLGQAPPAHPVLALPPPAVPAPSSSPASPAGLSATQIFSAGALPVLQLTERVLSSDLDDAADSKVAVDPDVAAAAAATESHGPTAATRRARSRSLFFTGHFTHGPGGSVHGHGSSTGTGSPFAAPNGMLVSPLLSAFKSLSHMRARGLSLDAIDSDAHSTATRPVLVSTSESPPMSVLQLGAPMVSAPPQQSVMLPKAALVLSSAADARASPSSSGSFNIHVSRCDDPVDTAPLLPSPSSGHADPPAGSEEDDAVITPSSRPGHADYSSTISALASSNPFALYPLAADASQPLTEWERSTRPLEKGHPQAGMYGSGFKPMSRAERKAALAMLSKVSSKRLKAQSWPRLMMHPGAGAGTSPSPGQTPGGGLSPLPAGDSPAMSGAPSPLPPSAGGRSSSNNNSIKPFAASNLSIDLRAAPVGPRTPAPADAALLLLHSTRRLHPFSPNPHASPPTPLSRSLSSQEHPPHASAYPPPSGSSTPSGTLTPGGTRVTLGMGLRSRTKSSVNISAGGGMSPGPFSSPPPLGVSLQTHRLSIGGSYTPLASGQPSPALSPSFGPSSARGNSSSSSGGASGFPSQSAPPLSGHAQASPSPTSATTATAYSFGSSAAPLHRRQASGSAAAAAAAATASSGLGPPLSTSGSLLASPPVPRRKLSGGPPTPPVVVVAQSLAQPAASVAAAASPSLHSPGQDLSPSLRVRGVGSSAPGSREGSVFVASGSPSSSSSSSGVHRRVHASPASVSSAMASEAPGTTAALPPPPPSNRPLYVIIALLVLLLLVLSALLMHTQREAAIRAEMQISIIRQEMAAAAAAAQAQAQAQAQAAAAGARPSTAHLP